jgi:uncharacterized membrane protein
MKNIKLKLNPKFKKKLLLSGLHLFLAVALVVITPLLLSDSYNQSIQRIREGDPVSQARSNLKNYRAKVIEVLDEVEAQDSFSRTDMVYQEVIVEILEGDKKDQRLTLTYPISVVNRDNERLSKGDAVVVSELPDFSSLDSNQNQDLLEIPENTENSEDIDLQKTNDDETLQKNSTTNVNESFQIEDQSNFNDSENFSLVGRYRFHSILWLLAFFILIIVILAGIKGLTATLAVIFSLTVLIQFLIPQILNGGNIIWTTFLVSVIIGLVSLFLSHGFSKRTIISSLAMLITLVLSTFFADFAVEFTKLTGLSSDEVFSLQTSQVSANINFQGLLLAGIIIGSIGVLDDVIVAQATAIQEISSANPALKFVDLVKKGFIIGKEHIISMVNSLAFAYVGSSLPILLLFVLYSTSELWMILNQELISEEIIRTLVGSVTLFLAVPITTILSAKFLQDKSLEDQPLKSYFSNKEDENPFDKLKSDFESSTEKLIEPDSAFEDFSRKKANSKKVRL